LLDQQPKPKDHSIRVEANFEFFKERVAEVKGELPALCKGLAKLVIVDISLNRDQDNPQLIFESLNSTGRELSQADLIRNFILMGLEPQLQTKLYGQYWRPMEVDFGQEGYSTHFDSFMRHYLTVKTGEIPNVREVYDAFKQYARSLKVAAAGVEALVADIRAFAGYYCAMALGSEPDADIKAAFHDIRELKVDVAFPFARQGRVAAGQPVGRRLCVPASGVRHPHQLDEQDLRDLRAGAQEGPLPGERAGALPSAAVVPPLPDRRRVPA